MPGQSLPDAKLRTGKFRSNVLDRGGPIARDVQRQRVRQGSEDIILL